jgi:transcriptional regulator with XRE-family HTH domain
MSARQRQFLLGLLLGHTQAQLAADSGITQGAVSQALRRSAAYAVEAAQRSVEEVADCFS